MSSAPLPIAVPRRMAAPVRQALVLGTPGDRSAVLAGGLSALGVAVDSAMLTDPGLGARLLRHQPDLIVAVAVSARQEQAACLALAALREGPETPVAPMIAAVGPAVVPGAELLRLVDDFVLPPHHPAEVLLRAATVVLLRAPSGPALISAGPLTVDVDGFRVWLAGATINLTYTEFQLVRLLLLNRGKVLTRQTLLNKIWGYDYLGGLRTVDVHIRRLRAKIEGEAPNLIETVRHAGYRIAE